MFVNEFVMEFLLVVEQGNVDVLKVCFEKGVDINVINCQKRIVIVIVSLKKYYFCVVLLIDVGVDIDKQDQICFNFFLISCLINDLILLWFVLFVNLDLDCLICFGGVGIMFVSEKGYVEIVCELLEKIDINVNYINFVGWMLLLEVIVLNDGGLKQQVIVKLLLDYGVNLYMIDKYGKILFELVWEKGYYVIVDQLLVVGV